MTNAFLVRPLPFAISIEHETPAPGTATAYLGNDYIGVVYRSPAGSGSSVQIDLGASVPVVNFAAMLSSNRVGAETWQVRADDDDDVTAGPIYSSGSIPFAAGAELPSTGRANSWWEHPTTEVARHWRFDVNGLGGGYFEAGRLVIGKKIEFERNYSFGAGRGVKDTGSIDFSTTGNLLRRFGRRLRTLSISYQATTRAEIEEKVLPLFEAIGNTECVFVCLNGAEDPQRQRRMYYGPLQGDLSTVHRFADGYEWRCQLVSLI